MSLRLLKAAPQPFGLLPEPRKHDIEAACWLYQMLEPTNRRAYIDRTKHVLSYHHFDAIAFSGLSGALIAPILAIEMGKTLLCVRRNGETRDSHSSRMVEGDVNAMRYIIVDDFTSTGATVRHIFDEVRKAAPSAKCIGVLEHTHPKTDLTPISGRQYEKWDLDAKNIREAVTFDEFIYNGAR
jgi:hypothetical protein